MDNSNSVNNYAQHAKNINVVEKSPQNALSVDNYPQSRDNIHDIKEELEALKSDLSTMEKRDKQREKSTFSPENMQGGQSGKVELWKSEKLSTMGVDNIYKQAQNPFKAGMLVKKNMAKGLSDDGETMLYSLLPSLDFKCDGDNCEIRVMHSRAGILKSNMEVLQKHASGFKIKLIEIQSFADNSQVEVDKIKKYFGEGYVKMVANL
ncbi:MAG: hypothetical protein R3Y32_08795 [Bacillota bacterium]